MFITECPLNDLMAWKLISLFWMFFIPFDVFVHSGYDNQQPCILPLRGCMKNIKCVYFTQCIEQLYLEYYSVFHNLSWHAWILVVESTRSHPILVQTVSSPFEYDQFNTLLDLADFYFAWLLCHVNLLDNSSQTRNFFVILYVLSLCVPVDFIISSPLETSSTIAELLPIISHL